MDNNDFAEASLAKAAATAQLPPELQEIAAELGEPILHRASVAGELELVRELLNAGLAADMYPCSEDDDDQPPLTWIARQRDQSSPSALDVAELLIKRGAGVDEGLPLLAAIQSEDLSMMRLLLASGAHPELVFEEAEPHEAKLLRQVLDLGWDAQAHAGGHYYLACDDDQHPLAVGDSEANALNTGLAVGGNNGVVVWRATERLVARFLSGEDLCWVGNGVADLE